MFCRAVLFVFVLEKMFVGCFHFMTNTLSDPACAWTPRFDHSIHVDVTLSNASAPSSTVPLGPLFSRLLQVRSFIRQTISKLYLTYVYRTHD